MTWPRGHAAAFALAATAVAVAWCWKLGFWWAHLGEARAFPVAVDGLPAWLSAWWLAAAAFAVPPLALAASFVPRRGARVAAGAALLVASAIACWHLETFNDATFVTSFWASAWLTWLAVAPEVAAAAHGQVLARAVVAVVFLGGATGKLSTEYWSGEAFHQLYVVQKDGWLYESLRASTSPEALRALARWFSRAVVVAELILATGPLWPARRHGAYVIVALVTMAGMVVISTWYLVSVLAPLAGVLIASKQITPQTLRA